MKFTVYTKPIPKGRPRFSMRGGYPRAYTPQKTRDFEDIIRSEAIKNGCRPLPNALQMTVEAWFEPPRSWSTKKRKDAINGVFSHILRPDCDNLGKGILDSLNGVAFLDDAQIYSLTVTKGYAEQDCIDITLNYV